MEREKVIEIFLALIFLVLVLILVFVGLTLGNSQTTSNTISNSYNKIDNSYNKIETPQKTPVSTEKTVRTVKEPTQKTYYYIKDTDSDKTNKKYYYVHSPSKNPRGYYSHNNYEPKGDYVWDWNEWDERSYSKDYDSFGKHTLDKTWAFDTDTYKVYVYNDGPGDYFKVNFYFEDCWGHEKSYEMRKYISNGEENLFYFRDINSESDKYCDWRYVVSH